MRSAANAERPSDSSKEGIHNCAEFNIALLAQVLALVFVPPFAREAREGSFRSARLALYFFETL